MDKSIFTTLSAIAENQAPRQQLSNEIANLSTIGFKRSYSAAMKATKVTGAGFDSRYLVTSRRTDHISLAPGTLTFTGNPMDVAMNGSTVMAVSAPNGELAFTRRGDLRVNAAGAVENGAGHLVRGANGPLTAPAGYMVHVTGDGTVYAANPDPNLRQAPQQVGRILLRDASAITLERRPDGLFRPSPEFATPDGDFRDGPNAPSLTVATVEGSNASAFEALTKLIDFSRTHEAAIRYMKEMKSMDESGSSMLRVG